jgi:Zn-dependent protease with chaperone function
MTLSLTSLAILNILLISSLSFITSWLLIEGILFLFRVRSLRFRSFARMIPFFKLPLDLYLMQWSNWALTHEVYPWLCEKDTRLLGVTCKIPNDILGYLFPQISLGLFTQENYTFSLVDCLAYWLGSSFLRNIMCAVICLFLSCFFLKCIKWLKAFSEINTLLQSSTPIQRKVVNRHLQHAICRSKVLLVESNLHKGSPFVTGIWRSKIIFPSSFLALLTDEEYEAVLAHEMLHVRFRDPLWKFFLHALSTLFIWIPTRALEKRIYQDQELSCDQNPARWGMESHFLASAIYKQAKIHYRDAASPHRICFSESNRIKKRLQALLDKPPKKLSLFSWCFLLIVSYLLAGVLFGRLWIL